MLNKTKCLLISEKQKSLDVAGCNRQFRLHAAQKFLNSGTNIYFSKFSAVDLSVVDGLLHMIHCVRVEVLH